MDVTTLPSTLKLQAVAMANEIGRTLTGDFAPVQKLVDDSQIVFGIWQDRAEPEGVGMLLVKGAQQLREIVASGRCFEVSWTAIPCSCAEQAVALQQVAGEPDRRH